ncbi:hypothetical protein T552_00053 [Pneumocystis carinii B80]|uniref:ADP-ribosylation factor GTPase-activating protein n=1 Tax=Pneumocystis carinii (strain B80) TaxID=1408658 RepID=A0A0W4ZSR3_PNEC8|nr:hypothetical protein T552_00053 [Pneumocystis carinii B80]KTW31409.1 hypothetical protein T552_00053 [Pneumocystis carinii B80]
MGHVGSKMHEKPTIYINTDRSKLFFKSIVITNSKDQAPTYITVEPYPETSINVSSDRELPIEFIYDPEASTHSFSPFLLKLYADQEIQVKFDINIRLESPEEIETKCFKGLFFIYGSNMNELDNILESELKDFENNQNILFLDDISTDGLLEKEFEWSWTWKPHSFKNKYLDGWRNTCYFVQRENDSFSILAKFNFWVQGKDFIKRSESSITFFDNKTLSLSPHDTSILPQKDSVYQNEDNSPEEKNALFNSLLCNLNSVVNFNNFDDAFKNEPNDGPLFRAMITALEKKTTVFRYRIKKLIKRAVDLYDSQITKNEANRRFMSALKKISESNPVAMKPVLKLYMEAAIQQLQSFEYNNALQLQRLIIRPLKRIYEADIKAAERKKKNFEEDSHDYYHFVSRYLSKSDSSKDKKIYKADVKYFAKKRDFELKCFDYYSFMQDLSGGKKEQEILHLFTLYVENHYSTLSRVINVIHDLKPGLDKLTQGVQEINKNFMHLSSKREEQRRVLEKSKVFVNESNNFFSSTTHQKKSKKSGYKDHCSASNRCGSSKDSSFNSNVNKLTSENAEISISSNNEDSKGIEDSNENDSDSISQRRKEGLLWALSRPRNYTDHKVVQKLNWHKYWIVLAGGKLCEYQNWKQAIDLHNIPIDLRMASVKKVPSVDRRFCFEVITPSIRRIYQATSEEDVSSWVKSISKAIESLLEGTGSTSNFCPYETVDKPPIPKSNGGLFHRNILTSNLTIENDRNTNKSAHKLLRVIHDADPIHNTVCADCNTSSKAEWCSINIPAILCIECSGVHRSLGSHISKVRSLMLDTTSFTDNLIDFICQTGNKMTNSIYEATYDSMKNLKNINKPFPTSSREEKYKFIYAKYVDKAFVLYNSNPTKNLLLGINNKHIESVIQALASGADPNTIDAESGNSALILSLFSSSHESQENDLNSSYKTQKETFPIAEYLLQNGANLPEYSFSVSNEKLSIQAKAYLQSKYPKKYPNNEDISGNNNTSGSNNKLLITTDNSLNNFSFLYNEHKNPGKLQKKINSNGKLSKLL